MKKKIMILVICIAISIVLLFIGILVWNGYQKSKKSKTISLDAITKISTYNEKDEECFSTDEESIEKLEQILSDIRYKKKFENDDIEGSITIQAYSGNKLIYRINYTGEVFIINGNIYETAKPVSENFYKLVESIKE
ncbi:MAG TPA: hypothetical protein VHQ24_15795 [Lachnospiraceae bacterium]|nr:hypothetical protein [Lachnospiraceae bacterium]